MQVKNILLHTIGCDQESGEKALNLSPHLIQTLQGSTHQDLHVDVLNSHKEGTNLVCSCKCIVNIIYELDSMLCTGQIKSMIELVENVRG